jgi:hypothetical protein
VTGGGLSFDDTEWIPCKRSRKKKKRFFIHIKILGKAFRGKLIDFLMEAYARGELQFHDGLARLSEAPSFENYLNRSVRHDWVVYSKRPFESATLVLKYLARYTHYAHGGKQKS